MFNRKILFELRAWAALGPEQRKPLILRGARQVGKTTAIDLFAQEFNQYIKLNLDLIEERRLFADERSFADTLAAIFLHKNLKHDPNKKTLLFIDEIQSSPIAVALLRYFYEKAPDLFVIAAGSLLETLIDKGISFPVGRVTYSYMYPLTFMEFLEALGEAELVELMHQIPLPVYAHDKLLTLFHRYTLIGGMPEIVQNYSINHDIVALNQIYQDLMISYVDDMEKYAKDKKEKEALRHVIGQAPFEVGKRIKFQGFGASNYGSREMGAALRTLEKAMLLYLVYPTTSVAPPMMIDFKKSPRLQFLDTGLINYTAQLQKYFFTFADLQAFYQGIIAEHIVGQELLAVGLLPDRKLHFWVKEKKQSSAEIDFILPFENRLVPIEVKAGKTGTLRSLHQFIDAADHKFGVRLSANTFSVEKSVTVSGKEFSLINIPYYLTANLTKYFEKYSQ